MADTKHAQLIAWLEDTGTPPEEIESILAQVEAYDQQTMHESVFDSINSGSIDIGALIRDVIKSDADFKNKAK